jgi:hypothetical protein
LSENLIGLPAEDNRRIPAVAYPRLRKCFAFVAGSDGERLQDAAVLGAAAAAFRRQSRHRQSSPSSGIGSRAVSCAHQHGPARLQVNSVPQREQARRREAGISNRSVINRADSWPCSSYLVRAEAPCRSPAIYAEGQAEGNPIARDSQAAFAALNRFGLGARGGAIIPASPTACWRKRYFPTARR